MANKASYTRQVMIESDVWIYGNLIYMMYMLHVT